jgi:hypothetical protein
VQRHILHDSVALVEDAENGNALSHRRHAALPRRGRWHALRRDRRVLLLLAAAPARRQHEGDQQRCGTLRHVYSGIHGS